MIKEKEYNIKTRVLSIFLIAAVVCSFMPIGAVITDKVYANKGDKITLKVDEKVYYGGAWTTKLEVTDTTADMEDAEGRFVYCVQPSKYTPGPGEYTIDKEYTDETDGKGAKIRKLLYYSKGFAGYSKHGGKAVWADKGFTGDMAYVAAHLCLAYLYKNDAWADDFWGFSDDQKSKAKAAMNTLLSSSYDDPPESFRCFIIQTSGYQDYVGGYYEQKGYLELQKKSENTSVSGNNDLYSLSGAKYGVYESSSDAGSDKDRVGTLTTTADGSTNTLELSKGSYYIKELTASGGYAKNTEVMKVTVEPNETTKVKTGLAVETPKNGMFEFEKTDIITGSVPQGDASFINTEFTVKHFCNDDGNTQGTPLRTFVLKPGQNGIVKSDAAHLVSGTLPKDSNGKECAPLGTYLITEKTPDEGYLKSTKTIVVTIKDKKDNVTSEKDVIVKYRYDGGSNSDSAEYPNTVKRAGLKLKKYDNDLDEAYYQGDATLAGAEFTITNLSDKPVTVANSLSESGSAKKVAKNGVVGVITTNADGLAQTNAKALPYGTYYIEETKPSLGYKKDTTWGFTVRYREDGIYLKAKNESNFKKAGEFSDGSIADLTGYTVQEPVIRGDVCIEKWDKELDKSEAMTGKNHKSDGSYPDLNGIEFTIKNSSSHDVVVPKVIDPSANGYKTIDWSIKGGKASALENGDAKRVAPGGTVGVITTHWNDTNNAYEAKTGGHSLPYGTYEISETRTNKFYQLTDTKKRTIEVRRDGSVVENTKETDPLVWKDYVYRQNLEFLKIGEADIDIQNRLSYIPFKITNNATGKSIYVVTNKNGQFNSFTYPHNRNTNGYDAYINSVVESGGIVDSEKLKEIMLGDEVDEVAPGTWFGWGEDGTYAEPNNEFAAFPYGEYTIEEIRCTNNMKYELTKPFVFKSEKPAATDPGYPNLNVNPASSGEISLGTIKNEYPVPKIQTSASDDKTKINLGVIGDEVTIIDTVTYSGLTAEQEYTIKGTLMNADTGAILLSNGKKVTAEKTFTPDPSGRGTVKVEFELDSRELKNVDTVVFEKLYLVNEETGRNEEIAKHEDINDDHQTIHYPDAKTRASDTQTNGHVGVAGEKTSIDDLVMYKNLIPGKEYTVKGTLVNKETGEALKENGNEITVEKAFVPEEKDGMVTLTFNFDSSALNGKTLVVFEDVFYEGVKVVSHAEITDEDQSTHYPKVGTMASDQLTKDGVGTIGKETTIIDSVRCENLIEGKEYTVEGVIMDKSTGEAIIEDGKQITSNIKFTAESENQDVQMEFKLDSEKLKGKSIVMFEELKYLGITVAEHKDITDEGQTVDFPDARTKAKDAVTETDEGVIDEKSTIVDTVSYTNLTIGKEYTVKGTLMDKETGQPLKDGDKTVTAETTFTAEQKDGSIEMTFTVSSDLLRGKTVVVFEDVYHNGEKIVTHADINDKDQTVVYPDAKTTAKDSRTQSSIGVVGSKTEIIDTVAYTNLTPGKEYTLKGVLMDKDKKSPLIEKGRMITSEIKFIPKEKDGSIDMKFSLDSEALKGKSVVVFEEVYMDDLRVVFHADINDEGQTVNYPDAKTNASDAGTKTNIGTVGSKVVLKDKVTYTNLVPGKEYKVTGKLMDKKTGKPLTEKGKEITASKTFRPESKDGYVEIMFTVDSTLLEGKTAVAFEDIYHEGVKVVSHADINDEEQTVYYNKIRTTATANGKHTVSKGGAVTITDKVEYRNLVPGKKYTLKGKLIDKSTSRPLVVRGKTVTAAKTFTAKKADGFVELKFKTDADVLKGKTTVVFERLYFNKVKIGAHENLSDKAQTVRFTNTTDTPGNKPPKTSDSFPLAVMLLLFAGSAGALAYVIRRRKSI